MILLMLQKCCNLSLIIASKTLETQDVKLMGLKSLMLEGEGLLGIGTIIDDFYNLGKVP